MSLFHSLKFAALVLSCHRLYHASVDSPWLHRKDANPRLHQRSHAIPSKEVSFLPKRYCPDFGVRANTPPNNLMENRLALTKPDHTGKICLPVNE